MNPDTINGVFEGVMALMLSRSVLLLYRHKTVKGVSFWAVAWPTLWGYWNLYYYPHLGQFWSFSAGIGVVVVNTTWIVLALRYRRRS